LKKKKRPIIKSKKSVFVSGVSRKVKLNYSPYQIKTNINVLPIKDREKLVETALQKAEFLYKYRWCCQKTFNGWETTFLENNYYTIPYSQPYFYGGYLFYNITLDKFEEHAKNKTGKFYDYHDNNGGTTQCPTYGTDCSAFVSFCIGSKTRYSTKVIKNYADNSAYGFCYKDFDTAEKGDLLNCNNNDRQHVLIIKEVNGEDITTYESTTGYKWGNTDIFVRTQTKAQWKRDGYQVVWHDYVTNCGGAPFDDLITRQDFLKLLNKNK